MNIVKELLSKLKKENIKLILNGDNIEVVSYEEKISQELIKKIKSNKKDLVNYLKSIENSSDIPISPDSKDYSLSSAQRLEMTLSECRWTGCSLQNGITLSRGGKRWNKSVQRG